ncbi:uncharacterized protein [Ptychodera flava]|uniref:uncharacterized protein n=1 Tax=Ptychodera flava TaxID=63121 RepID=UPI00396A5B78
MKTWQERMNKEEYKNWLKVSQALLLLCQGVEKLTTEVVDKFHGELVKQCASGSQSICTDVSCKKSKQNQRPSCGFCKKFEREIVAEHKNKGSIHWNNFDWKKWPVVAWEVAKVYMPGGQKAAVCTASETDSSALLNLMSNCKKFHSHIDKNKPGKVIQVRNKTMHSAQMEFTNHEMKDHIKVILDLVHELKNRPEAKQAAKTISKLRDGSFVITQEVENEILKDRFEEFERRLGVLEEKLSSEMQEAIEKFQNFINGNSDLKEIFGTDLSSLENRVKDLEHTVQNLDERLSKVEKGGKRAAPLPSMFKNHLQQYCQENKINLPEYESIPAENGFYSKVTVDGKTYKSKELRTTKVDSEQDAAREALRSLGRLDQEEGATSDGNAKLPFDEDTNYIGILQEHFQKIGLSVPDYESNKCSDNPAKFTAWVDVSQKDSNTKKRYQSEDMHSNAKRAKHAAAKTALEALNIPLIKNTKSGDESPKCQQISSPNKEKTATAVTLPDKTSTISPIKCHPPADGVNFKGALQEFIKKQGITDEPVYEDILIKEQTYTANVKFKTKFAIQSDRCSKSKKESESLLAQRILTELKKPPSESAKAKLNELGSPNPVYETYEVDCQAKVKEFMSIMLYAKITSINEITIKGKEQFTKKKEAQQNAAKNAVTLLRKLHFE